MPSPSHDRSGSADTARRFLLHVAAVVTLAASVLAAQPPMPAEPTAEERQAYQAFMTWYVGQPPDVQRASDDEINRRYAATLEATGVPAAAD